MKPALVSLKERTAARERDLIGETLALEERLDSGSHTLTERAEDNACLEAQVTKPNPNYFSISQQLRSLCICSLFTTRIKRILTPETWTKKDGYSFFWQERLEGAIP